MGSLHLGLGACKLANSFRSERHLNSSSAALKCRMTTSNSPTVDLILVCVYRMLGPGRCRERR
jgi:hypothetical protein